MESIQSALGQIIKGRNLESQLEKTKQQLLQQKSIKAFLEEFSVSANVINRSLPKLFEYNSEVTNCQRCPGLNLCPNMMKGYKPTLVMDGNRISTSYSPCEIKMRFDEKRKQQSLIKSLYIPKEILEANFTKIETNTRTRLEAIQAAFQFATSIIPGENSHGLYLHGKFGVGKTYIMGAIANELADRKIETLLVYTPDFFREMKQGISDGTFSKKLETVKRSKVLILDDIGSETMSSWVRDEILGVILQYRMLEKLPTLFTSNYDLDELEEHLAYSDKSGIEELKAKRIMERIRHYTTAIFIDGDNRRKK